MSLQMLPAVVASPPAKEPPLLDVSEITLNYRQGNRLITAIEGVSFAIAEGERLMLLGPSGCGKSTLLKAIGGFLPVRSGEIRLRGRPVNAPGPDRGLVFQEFDQLLPWKTVKQNVVFGIRAAGRASQTEAGRIALEYLEKVRLSEFADAYPHTLSGGMKQRVAIARCLALRPQIVLMDEPFAALDELSRQRMQQELLRLWQEDRFTLLFVTHSISEAMVIGSRVLLLSPRPGRVLGDFPMAGAAQADLRCRIETALLSESEAYVI